jgi:hypothetical protein
MFLWAELRRSNVLIGLIELCLYMSTPRSSWLSENSQKHTKERRKYCQTPKNSPVPAGGLLQGLPIGAAMSMGEQSKSQGTQASSPCLRSHGLLACDFECLATTKGRSVPQRQLKGIHISSFLFLP